MLYNFTSNYTDILLPFDIINQIVPMSSGLLLVAVPFIILFIAMIRFGASIAFTVASTIAFILSVLFTSTGIITNPMFVSMTLGMTIIGFIWVSMSSRGGVQTF